MKALKANSKERTFYKKLQRALALAEELLKETHSSRDGRYIAFNCKVPGYLSTESVRDMVREMKLPFAQSRAVLREFTEQRIENIYLHQLQRESDSFKDLVNGSCYVSPAYVQGLISEYFSNYPSLEPIVYPDLRKELTGVKSFEKAKAKISSFFRDSVSGYKHSCLMNSKDVFQFGSNGGWFAVANESDIEDYASRIKWSLEEHYKTENDILLFLRSENETRDEALDYIMNDCDTDSITNHCRAIQFFLNEGKEIVQSMKKKSYLLEAVAEEIRIFLSEQPVTISEEVEIGFIEGKNNLQTNQRSKSLIRRSSRDMNLIETSQGVKVPIREGLALYTELTEVVEGRRSSLSIATIGGFNIDSFDMVENDWILKAGCHSITYKHIQLALPTLTAAA